MRIDPAGLRPRDRHRLLISAIVPRPIAFVTSLGPGGVVNLAPFSFFQGVSASPPTVSIAVARKRDGSRKDTWRNIETTGEYVIHGVTDDRMDAVMVAAAEWPETESEVARAGLATVASERIAVPRLAGPGLAMECRLHSVHEIHGVGLIVGEVVLFHVSDDLLAAGDSPTVDYRRYHVIGRIGGDGYVRRGEVFERRRLRPEDLG
jgi:flavin reductase (DIM6/NTAB) family NADH-FMN oxidoreductase RutF